MCNIQNISILSIHEFFFYFSVSANYIEWKAMRIKRQDEIWIYFYQ